MRLFTQSAYSVLTSKTKGGKSGHRNTIQRAASHVAKEMTVVNVLEVGSS